MAVYLLLVLIIVSAFRFAAPPLEEKTVLDYSELYSMVEQGQVKNLSSTPKDGIFLVEGELQDGQAFMVNAHDAEIVNLAREKGVTVKINPEEGPPWYAGILATMLPILLLVGLVFFMMQQTQGGGNKVMQFGKSKAKLHTDESKKVTFDDVAGADEVKEELEEIIEFLQNPRKFNELGAKIPKGVLLYGPPGTGKTLLAKAVAGESGVPFFSISGSDFVEMFVGVGASRVRDLFEQAKKNAPCIIFIDEIDAVGRQRGAGLGGGHDEREQTLNQLLVEMDGFNANEGIIMIAATNRPDILDPALLRPGRFDRQITVDVPDVKGREEILEVHIKGKPLDEEVDLSVLARRTPGFTGADLANLVNEGALLAARRNKKNVSMNELEDSVERVIAGPEKKSRVISEYEKRLVAYHEAGHAIVGHYLPTTDPVHKVSIIPRGGAGGYTLILPKEDRRFMTKSQILDQVTMLLGGRVAEEMVLKEISTGAQNDLERATGLVRKLITEFGMSDELGPLTFGHKQEQVFLGRDISRDRNYSEAVAFSIDKEARRMMDTSYKKAEDILTRYMDKLHLVATNLIERETLAAQEFNDLIDGKTLEPLPKKSGKLSDAATKTPSLAPEKRDNPNIGGPEPVLRFNHDKKE